MNACIRERLLGWGGGIVDYVRTIKMEYIRITWSACRRIQLMQQNRRGQIRTTG